MKLVSLIHFESAKKPVQETGEENLWKMYLRSGYAQN